MRPFLDTSVLISGLIDQGAASRAPQSIFDAIADARLPGPHTAWHCCLEFFAVTTRLPRELRLSPDVALRLIDEELLARFTVQQLPAEARGALLSVVAGERIQGGRIYDAHIAEVARTAEVTTVVTDNRRHFLSLRRVGIEVLSSQELAARLS